MEMVTKGSGDEGSVVTLGSGDEGSGLWEVVTNLWLQIALEWLHESCMLCVAGRKAEHQTLCFAV